MRWGWERLAALSGIVAVALWIIGIAIREALGVADVESAQDALAYFQDEENGILAAGFTFQIGTLFFLIFLSALRSRLWRAEGGTGMLTTLAFASGVAVAIFLLALPAADIAAALEDDLEPAAAQALLALLLLIVPIGWAALLIGVPLWVLVTSVLIYLRPAEPAQVETTARPPVG